MAWARLDDGLGDHPKVLDVIETLDEMVGAAAMGLWSLGLAYAHRTMRTAKTPGFIPRSYPRTIRVPASLGDKLCDAGLWEHAEGGWIIHDFGDYLPSEKLRAKRAEAGRRGAEARWAKKSADQAPGKPGRAGSDSNLPSDANGKNGNACPEPEPEPEPKKRTTSSSSSATASPRTDPAPKPERADVQRICDHLAARVEGNGSNRPEIKQTWRDAARLMLDKDGRTEADVHAAIDWCQNDEFWRGNVLSLPKLREKYDQLRLQAQRQNRPGPRRADGPDWDAAMARARARDAATAEPADTPDDEPLWRRALPA